MATSNNYKPASVISINNPFIGIVALQLYIIDQSLTKISLKRLSFFIEIIIISLAQSTFHALECTSASHWKKNWTDFKRSSTSNYLYASPEKKRNQMTSMICLPSRSINFTRNNNSFMWCEYTIFSGNIDLKNIIGRHALQKTVN